MIKVNSRLVLLICVSAYLAYSPLLKAQEDQSQADLTVLAKTISDTQSLIENTRQQRSVTEVYLETNEKAINAINQSISTIQDLINNEQIRFNNLEQKSTELNIQRSNQEVLVGQYLLAAYQNGKEEYIKLLLNQQSITSSARVLKYYQYFNEARTKRITNFREILIEIESISSELQESNRNLLAKRNNLIDEQNNLKLRKNERLNLLMELDIALATKTNELSRLEVRYKETALLIEGLSLAILELPFELQDEKFLSLRGSLPWPLQGPLLNAYGENYELGDLNWEGVTIAGKPGTEVRTIHHGRIIFSDWFSNSGLLLIIDHGDGYMSIYAHNQSLFKEVGEWVTSGEIIASVGNTGGRNEIGVYFEIRYNGVAQDPVNWLVRR